MPFRPSPKRLSGGGDPASGPAARGERLQKVLAAAGLGSRRKCEELILEGRVEVDGQVVSTLGLRVDPLEQRIRVDGTVLSRPERIHFVVNKPSGVLCTNQDPSGRVRVIDLIHSNERLFTVGRLDRSSEGLILVTNDGELANRLTHPRYGVAKVYRVRVAGHPSSFVLEKLRRGVHLAEGIARAASVDVKHRHKESTELEITLNEGRNREIRRLFARVGHKVLRLKRVAIGPLRLGDLPVGAHRPLNLDELRRLESAVRATPRSAGPSSRRRPRRGHHRSEDREQPAHGSKGAKEPRRFGTVLASDMRHGSGDGSRPRRRGAARKRRR